MFEDVVEQFLKLAPATAPSPHSLRQYRMVLWRYAEFCGREGAPPVRAESVQGYMAELRGCGLRDASLGAHDRVLRVFFRQAEELGWIEVNPMERLRRPRRPERLPRSASLEAFGRMVGVAVCRVVTGDITRVRAFRDLVVLVVLADSGLRASELGALRWRDVDLAACSAVVREGKGRKQRIVLFRPETCDLLEGWRRVCEPGQELVVMGLSGRGALTASGVSQILHKLADAAEVEGPHRAHAFRHLFGGSYMAGSGDQMSLARLMGHSDLRVTQGYVAFDLDDLRRKHGLGSPVGMLLGNG